METKFQHKVSRGSRFNQIYIPREMEDVFEVGDRVEVRLLKKKNTLYYSKNLKKVSSFKEKLITEVFSSLSIFPQIKQIFVVGSFLTEQIDYHDVDLMIITDKEAAKTFEEKLYTYLIDKFQLKFHIISMPEEYFANLVKICPLTRSMLFYFISNKNFELTSETKLDKNHINFLLMMSEDLLKLDLSGRSFYDGLRRLLTINKFIENKELDPIKINSELKSLLGDFLYYQLKNNESIDKNDLANIRKIMKNEISKIQRKI